eukprot:3157269-Rhodomonas_salina.4
MSVSDIAYHRTLCQYRTSHRKRGGGYPSPSNTSSSPLPSAHALHTWSQHSRSQYRNCTPGSSVAYVCTANHVWSAIADLSTEPHP